MVEYIQYYYVYLCIHVLSKKIYFLLLIQGAEFMNALLII